MLRPIPVQRMAGWAPSADVPPPSAAAEKMCVQFFGDDDVEFFTDGCRSRRDPDLFYLMFSVQRGGQTIAAVTQPVRTAPAE